MEAKAMLFTVTSMSQTKVLFTSCRWESFLEIFQTVSIHITVLVLQLQMKTVAHYRKMVGGGLRRHVVRTLRLTVRQ